MQYVFDLLREAARGGVTIGRAAVKVGRATVEIVVKVILAK